MKILSIGTDKSILNPDSALARRVLAYGNLVENYTIIVPADKNLEIKLSDKVSVCGVYSQNKIFKLFKIKNLAKSLLSKNKFDVITVQDPYYLGLLGLKLAKKFNLGLEIQVHGFEKLAGLRKIIAKYVLPRADSVRVVSQRLKKKLITDFKVSKDKIIVIPIYVKIGDSYQDKNKNHKFIFLTVSRLVSVKNIALQIRAFKNIYKNYQNTELWILGSGPLESELKQLAADTDSIKFFGQQKDVHKFYSQAGAFMLTSFAEGWPLVIIEAASYKLPIIMTDVGSAGELIIDNQSGLIIAINNQAALEKAMLSLVNDQILRERLGQGAYQAVQNLPDQKQILDLYKKSWVQAYERCHTSSHL